jgi:PAS domain S-box-containing protein
MGNKQKKNKKRFLHFEITDDIKDHILNLSLDLICIAGMDGYFKYLNPAWEKTLGYTRKELLSRPFHDFIHPDDHQKTDAEVEKLNRNQQTKNFQNRYIHKNGSIQTISWTATPLVEEKQIYCIGRDMTEHKKLEEELRNKVREWQIAFDSNTDAICLLDDKQRILRANHTMCKLTRNKASDLIGKHCWEVIHHSKRPIRECPIIRIKNSLKRERMELSWGDSYFNVTVDPILDDRKNMTGMVHTIRDITERKKLEEQHATIVKTTIDGFWMVDMQGRFLEVNDAFCKLTGYSRSELLTMRIPDIEAMETQEETKSRIQRIKKNGGDRFQTRHRCKDGSIVDIEVSVNYQKDLDRMFVFLRDITERKQTEEALYKERNLFKTLIDNIPDHIYFKDINSRFITINKSLAESFHIDSPEKAIGKTDFDFFTEEHAQQAYADEQKIIKSGNSIINFEEKETWSGNSETWVSTTKMPLINENGMIIGTFGISRDITESKKAIEALEASEMRYRELFDHINSGVVVYEVVNNGKDFIFRDFNQAGQKIEKTHKEYLIGKSVSQVFPGVIKCGLFSVFQRVWRTGIPEHHPVTLYRDDRIEGWRENYVYKLPTGEIVTVYEDVTDRKKSEEAIQKLAKFPNENPMPVLRIRNDGVLLYANQACGVILNRWNYSTDQPVPDEWRKIVTDTLDSGQLQEVEITFGNHIFSFIFTPIMDDDYVNIYGHDITERKQAEQALLKSEAQLSNAMSIANLGHWELDIASGMFTFSDNFYAIFRTNASEMGGYQMSFADYTKRFVHPDDTSLVGDETHKAMETDDPSYSQYLEHRMLYKDGSIGYIAVRFFIVKDDKGKTIKTYGVNQDITNRKQVEEQIRKNLREKEILLRELYHRTKNNMQVISSMLRMRARSLKNPQLLNAFNEIEGKILSMALVHQKLYESKDLSQLNLKDYINSLIVLIKQLYLDFMNNITIHTKMKDIYVLIDTAIPLGLVVNELLTNAIKHAFPDGRRGEIKVNLDVIPCNFLVLKISDNGIGLPKNFDFQKDIHLGLQTILDLAEDQLNGKTSFTNRNGLHFSLTVNKELYYARV